MKKAILQKVAVSGAAAIGILAFASPAAFAWSGNSSGGSNYESSYKQISSMRCYRMDSDSGYNSSSYWSSEDWRQNCRPMMMYGNSYQTSGYNSSQYNSTNNCDRASNQSYGNNEASYSNRDE